MRILCQLPSWFTLPTGFWVWVSTTVFFALIQVRPFPQSARRIIASCLAFFSSSCGNTHPSHWWSYIICYSTHLEVHWPPTSHRVGFLMQFRQRPRFTKAHPVKRTHGSEGSPLTYGLWILGRSRFLDNQFPVSGYQGLTDIPRRPVAPTSNLIYAMKRFYTFFQCYRAIGTWCFFSRYG